MSFEKMTFVPEGGFADTGAYPDPANEDEVREQLMRPSVQVRSYINEVMLPALAGADGARSIGATPMDGMEGESVQALMGELSGRVKDIIAGIVPDGSIDTRKLVDGAVTPLKVGFPVGVTWFSQMEPQSEAWDARGMRQGAMWVRPPFTIANGVEDPLTADASKWTAQAATLAAAGGTLTVRGNGTAQKVGASVVCTAEQGECCVYVEVRQNGYVAQGVTATFGEKRLSKALTPNEWTRFCFAAASAGRLQISADYPSAPAANGQTFEIRKPIVCDLAKSGTEQAERMTTTYAEAFFAGVEAAPKWDVPYMRWVCVTREHWQVEQMDGRVMRYCMFPDSLTPEEKAEVEGNPALMELAEGAATQIRVGDIVTTGRGDMPENYLPCDGRALLISAYTALYEVIKKRYGTTFSVLPSWRSPPLGIMYPSSRGAVRMQDKRIMLAYIYDSKSRLFSTVDGKTFTDCATVNLDIYLNTAVYYAGNYYALAGKSSKQYTIAYSADGSTWALTTVTSTDSEMAIMLTTKGVLVLKSGAQTVLLTAPSSYFAVPNAPPYAGSHLFYSGCITPSGMHFFCCAIKHLKTIALYKSEDALQWELCQQLSVQFVDIGYINMTYVGNRIVLPGGYYSDDMGATVKTAIGAKPECIYRAADMLIGYSCTYGNLTRLYTSVDGAAWARSDKTFVYSTTCQNFFIDDAMALKFDNPTDQIGVINGFTLDNTFKLPEDATSGFAEYYTDRQDMTLKSTVPAMYIKAR